MQTAIDPTEADFIAARESVYDCLSAVKLLSFTLDPVSPLILDVTASKSGRLPIRPADEKLSWTTRAVECLGKVLATAGPRVQISQVAGDSLDWSDYKCPEKIKKVKYWFLAVSTSEHWRSYSTAHEKAYWWARDLWEKIEFCIFSNNGWALYEPDPAFRLDLERVEKNVEEVKQRICEANFHSMNYEAAKADIERESAKAFAAWKRDGNNAPATEDGPKGLTSAEFNVLASKYLGQNATDEHMVTVRELQEHLKKGNPAGTCSTGTVARLPAWRAYQDRLERIGRKGKKGKHNAISLTGSLESVIGREDATLQRLIEEQKRDYEPSPLDDDLPDQDGINVYCRKRV